MRALDAYRSAAAALLLSSVAIACGGTDTDEFSAAEEAVGTCGSALGASIQREAQRGNSKTTDNAPIATRANRVSGGPYVGGRQISNALTTLILSAKSEVLVEFYDIETDSWLGGQLKHAIDRLHATRPAVKVHILTSPNEGARCPLVYYPGCKKALPEWPEDGVKRLGKFFGNDVHVGIWNRAYPLVDQIHGTTSDARGILHVMHTKVVVVDGARALMTDSNLQRSSDPIEERGDGWNQMAVEVEGTIAASLRAEILDAWSHAQSSEKVRPETFPALPLAAATTCTPMVVLGRGDGADEHASANLGYAQLFRGAHHKVLAMTPNLNDSGCDSWRTFDGIDMCGVADPDYAPGAMEALADATKDADVYLLLSLGFNDHSESQPSQGGTNFDVGTSRLPHFVESRVNKGALCNLHVRWYTGPDDITPGKAHGTGNGTHASHSKWASADGQTMILGSQNLDTQSWKESRELGLAIDDQATTKRFDDVFRTIWARSPKAYEGPGCGPAPAP